MNRCMYFCHCFTKPLLKSNNEMKIDNKFFDGLNKKKIQSFI